MDKVVSEIRRGELTRSCTTKTGHVLAVVDTGPLYAVADSDDAAHSECLALLESREFELTIPALVVASSEHDWAVPRKRSF